MFLNSNLRTWMYIYMNTTSAGVKRPSTSMLTMSTRQPQERNLKALGRIHLKILHLDMTCKYPTPNIKITSNLFHGIDILNHDAINLASLEAIV